MPLATPRRSEAPSRHARPLRHGQPARNRRACRRRPGRQARRPGPRCVRERDALRVSACCAIAPRGAIARRPPAAAPCSPRVPRSAGRDMAARACSATGSKSVREAMRESQGPRCASTSRRPHGHMRVSQAALDVPVRPVQSGRWRIWMEQSRRQR